MNNYEKIREIVMQNDTERLKKIFEDEDIKNKYFKDKIFFEICAQWGRLISLKCFAEEIYKNYNIQEIFTTRTLFESINGDTTYYNFLTKPFGTCEDYVNARLSHQSCLPYIMDKLNIKCEEDIDVNSYAFIFHYNLVSSAIKERNKCLLIKQEIKKINVFPLELIDIINNYIL
jgi:hypothetical protein